MQSKFISKTMEEILKQETEFIDRLMYQIESKPNFKFYLESVIDYEIDDEIY